MLTDLELLDKVILFSINSLIYLFKSLIALGSIYLILQRFHLRLQMRFLKNISDEIIKINDYIIDFKSKFELHKKLNNSIDEKNYFEIIALRNKIHNHLDYLSSLINSFPYGNPINFFWFSLKGYYLNSKIQKDADFLLTKYQSIITDDSILQNDINLLSFNKNTINISNKENIKICEISQTKIDDIIVNGLDLINLLEDHSKKLF